MAEPVPVDDPADHRLDDYRHLRDPDRRQILEARAGLLIAEGAQVVRRLLASPFPVRSLLVRADRVGAVADVVAALDAPVYTTSPRVLTAVTGFDVHRGVLAAADRLAPTDAAALVATATHLVVLEDVNDHENVGAAFRSAAALGADAVLLSPGCADPLYRRAVRVSMGAVLHIPFARADPWPDHMVSLTGTGWERWAMTPAPDAVAVHEAGAEPGARLALLFGAEGPGLSDAVLRTAHRRVRIPMTTRADSLNVAMAVAVGCYACFVERPAADRGRGDLRRGA